MRQLSIIVRSCPSCHRWGKWLGLAACCGFFLTAWLGSAWADELPAPQDTPDAAPLPVPPTSANAEEAGGNSATGTATGENSQNSDNSPSQNSDNTASNALAPNVPGPGNTENPNSPLLPSQALNTSPLYSSPGSNGGQPSVLNAPALYQTGAFDLSQVSATNALAQAFMEGGTISSEQTPDQGPSPLDRIRIGPVDLKTSLNFTVVGDDNIDAQPDGPNRVHDVEFTLTPAILLVYGLHDGQKGYASVVYAPTLSRFAHYSAQNSDDQNVALNLQYPFQRLTLNATETYAETTGVNLDARARTTQTTEVATFGGNYEVDDKISLQSNLEYIDSSYSGTGSGSGSTNNSGTLNNNGSGLAGDTRESVNTTASYHWSDKLTFGPGFNIGVESPEDSPQQTFEQGLLNVNFEPTEKIGIYGQGGVEWRQYGGGGKDQMNPVFSAGVNYAPTDAATLSLSGYQDIEPTSDNSSQTDVNTGVSFSGSERLFQKLLVGFSFVYAHTEYQADSGTNAPARTGVTTGPFAVNANGTSQDNFIYRPSLTYIVNQWSTVALYYQYQGNTSSQPGSSYYGNSLGFSVSAQF